MSTGLHTCDIHVTCMWHVHSIFHIIDIPVRSQPGDVLTGTLVHASSYHEQLQPTSTHMRACVSIVMYYEHESKYKKVQTKSVDENLPCSLILRLAFALAYWFWCHTLHDVINTLIKFTDCIYNYTKSGNAIVPTLLNRILKTVLA